ncbi:hypothetical protein KAH55_13090, partial [bacterium]|nr:hypothetical protein [bacterium]
MKILHIAPSNIAGVPMELVRAERAMGHESQLVTFFPSRYNFEEDICLNLPLLDHWSVRLAKHLFSPRQRTHVSFKAPPPDQIPRQWHSSHSEKLLISLREKLWQSKITNVIKKYGLLDFDVYQLDGGLGFYRDARIIQSLKSRGKKIICCYTGSDLRVRGVIPQIDSITDVNVSVEFDHQFLHPNLTHVPFPINPNNYPKATPFTGGKLRISHSPTNRQAKGSHIIIPVVEALAREYPVELVLIENMSYQQALSLKADTHVFIDQIGDLGYGISGLEALCMGIPACSCVAP